MAHVPHSKYMVVGLLCPQLVHEKTIFVICSKMANVEYELCPPQRPGVFIGKAEQAHTLEYLVRSPDRENENTWPYRFRRA